jgi:hypothetical protein
MTDLSKPSQKAALQMLKDFEEKHEVLAADLRRQTPDRTE